MKDYLVPVWTVTGYLFVYLVVIGLDLSLSLILFLFGLSPFLMLWMVYRVLKANMFVNHSFEDKWYEDGELRGESLPD